MPDINIYWVMIGISLIIILSFLYNAISRKTNIPAVILLIATGFLIGQFIKIDEYKIKPILEFLGNVGLIMIVLEAALDLHLERKKLGLITKAFLIAIGLLIITSLGIAYGFQLYFDMTFVQALIYAIPLAIMSSAIIIPSVKNLSHEKKEFLIFEAAFSDIIGIMIFYFTIDSLELTSARDITMNIVGNISITMLISIVLGFVMIYFIQKLEGDVKLFLPIAVLLLLYSVGKLFHLSSLIFVLTFGLMINNSEVFFRGPLKKLISDVGIDYLLKDIKLLVFESSFIIRTFFFIIFGMSITLNGLNDPIVYLIGIIILVFMYATRFGALKLLNRKQMKPALWVAPRGLITILLFYAIPKELIAPQFNTAVLLLIIVISSLVMMYGLIKHSGDDEVIVGEVLEEDTELSVINDSSDSE